MKVRVSLQDLKGQNRPNYDFWTEMEQVPMVGDLIAMVAPENAKTPEVYNHWYPDLQEFGASEFFKVLSRGWLYCEGEYNHPFIVVRNMDEN